MSSPTAQGAQPPADSTAPQEPPEGQRPPFSKVAIAALPAGVLPLVPVGIGLGLAGLAATRGGRRRGRGLALAGLLTATAWLAIGAALGTVAALTHGFHKPTRITYDDGLGTVYSLRQGDCVTGPQGDSSPIRTSCSVPHDAEVFATFPLAGTAWPGTAVVRREADAGCAARLAGYLNPQLALSLSQDYVYPGQVAWQTGTRVVICEVRAATGQLTQSVRGGPAA